ncbi:MAG: TolC family protein, partial [Gemmatimonadales bacterium]|nr:TolC family protein [Gemmatimonadales bacterium]
AARAAGARRAAGAMVLTVTGAYWDAQLATQRVAALDTGLAAARAHAGRAAAMRDQGLVSGLDARLARLRVAQLDAQRVTVQADAENALAALATLLALPDSVIVKPTDPLTVDSSDALPPAGDLSGRGDLQGLQLGSRAASLGVRRAWAAQLPSLAAFADVGQHSPRRPFGPGSSDWTIGVAIVWRPFPGLAGVGAVARARAEHDAAQARLEAGERQARLELAQAQRFHSAALRRMAVSRDARAEAAQALEQARLRYRTGTAPITELLDVQAALTNADLDLLAARHDVLVARAFLDFATGVNDR